jgi:hypothetical protein
MKKTQVYEWHKRSDDGSASVSDDLRCGLETFFDAQGLVRYEFITEGRL